MRIIALVIAGAATVGALVVPTAAQQKPAPAANPTDVKGIIFELANSMGMLRGLQQEDSILTLEHWAKGTLTVGGQKFDVPEYRMSINYGVPGMRVDFRRQPTGGQAQRAIEVVAGGAAWNETERGRNATAARDRVKERLVQLWTTPMGIVKAATLAGEQSDGQERRRRDGAVVPAARAGQRRHGQRHARRDNSLLVPDPAALKQLVGTYVARVETTGGVVSDTTYAEYGDWNWDDYQADIMQPRRITRKQGDMSLELMTVNTNTYNPYVIMPVPDNVK